MKTLFMSSEHTNAGSFLYMFPFQCLEQSFFCDDNSYFTYHIKSSDEQDHEEREVYFGNTRIEELLFAVFGPTESNTDTEDEGDH